MIKKSLAIGLVVCLLAMITTVKSNAAPEELTHGRFSNAVNHVCEILQSPQNVAAGDGVYASKIVVEWDATNGATHYDIYRHTFASAGVASKIGTVTGLSYEDHSAETNTRYYYWIKAVNEERESHFSAFNTGELAPNLIVEQVIRLKKGWNMISSYVTPDIAELEIMLASINDQLVIMKNSVGQVYWPLVSINNIEDWNANEGYLAYMTEDTTLTVQGHLVDVATQCIDLPAGWSIIPAHIQAEVSIDIILAELEDELVLAKNNFGQVYWPVLGINSIGNMRPSEGYQVYLSQSAQLCYPQQTSTSSPP